jgi:hypothetical protein
MRKLTTEELRTIAALRAIPEGDRVMKMLSQETVAIAVNSAPLPIIHQVLGD